MLCYFINPPFKAEYGKFSRENRSPCITRSGALYYPLWLIYAGAVCKKSGFDVRFLDAPAKPLDKSESLKIIAKDAGNVSLFVVSTSTPSIYSDVDFADELKCLYPDAFVVLVGTHVSALPEETLRLSLGVDAIARKEFDFIIRDIAVALHTGNNPCHVAGISYRKGKNIIHNEDMPYIQNLDEIPFAAEFIKEYLHFEVYFFAAAAYPEIQIFTGRGCSSRCSFCVYPQTMHGQCYRLRSPENVVSEFEYIAENFPQVKEVVIEDDNFTAKKDRVVKICELLIKKGLHKRLRWLCNARVNLDLDTMHCMKKAGCHLIIPGIESGSQQILNSIKKGITINQIHQYIADAKKAGLDVHACYMVGNMGETKATMRETLRLALSLDTDTAQFYPLLPFPGTEAYNWGKVNGYIQGDYSDYVVSDGTINSLLNLPEISSNEMIDFCDKARKKYYLRPRYFFYRLQKGLTDIEDFKRSFKAFMRIKKYLFKRG